jgi:hypothetical protein
MPSVTSLLARVQKLERGRALHPIAEFGTSEFEAEFRASVEANGLDPIDMLGESGHGGVLRCLQSWAENRVWLTARR